MDVHPGMEVALVERGSLVRPTALEDVLDAEAVREVPAQPRGDGEADEAHGPDRAEEPADVHACPVAVPDGGEEERRGRADELRRVRRQRFEEVLDVAQLCDRAPEVTRGGADLGHGVPLDRGQPVPGRAQDQRAVSAAESGPAEAARARDRVPVRLHLIEPDDERLARRPACAEADGRGLACDAVRQRLYEVGLLDDGKPLQVTERRHCAGIESRLVPELAVELAPLVRDSERNLERCELPVRSGAVRPRLEILRDGVRDAHAASASGPRILQEPGSSAQPPRTRRARAGRVWWRSVPAADTVARSTSTR